MLCGIPKIDHCYDCRNTTSVGAVTVWCVVCIIETDDDDSLCQWVTCATRLTLTTMLRTIAEVRRSGVCMENRKCDLRSLRNELMEQEGEI